MIRVAFDLPSKTVLHKALKDNSGNVNASVMQASCNTALKLLFLCCRMSLCWYGTISKHLGP